MKKIIITTTLALQLSNLLYATNTNQLVDEYIKISGTETALATLPKQIEVSLKQSKNIYKTNDNIQKSQAIKKAFSKDEIKKLYAEYLTKNSDKEFLKSVNSSHKSEIFKRITHEQINSMSPEIESEIIEYMIKLQSNPPNNERVEVVHNIVNELDLVDTKANIAVDLIKHINKMMPQQKQIDGKYISKLKNTLKMTYHKQMILTSFYLYRNFTNEELKQYLAYYKSKIGKREINTNQKALSYVLEKSFEKIK